MLNLSIASCPICYQGHTFEEVANGEVELRCPIFGDSFKVEITAVAKPLPVHLFGRQGALTLPVR